MKHRLLIGAVVTATAAALNLADVQAFSAGGHTLAPLRRTQFSLVQAQGQPDRLFRGVGVVTAVDPATGSLTINHQEIVGLMPPMEMLFDVDPRNLSDGVKRGDKIEFGVEGKTYKIRDIKLIEPNNK